jgi:hypothetical protein
LHSGESGLFLHLIQENPVIGRDPPFASYFWLGYAEPKTRIRPHLLLTVCLLFAPVILSFIYSENITIIKEKIMEQNTLYVITITILVALLILSILGTEMLINLSNWIVSALKVIFDFIITFLGSLSKNLGDLIIGTGDVVSDTSIFGIRILDGMIENVGNLFKGQATPVASDTNHLDIVIHNHDHANNKPPLPVPEPANVGKEDEKWCYVGTDASGRNTCVKLQPNQKCMSNAYCSDNK